MIDHDVYEVVALLDRVRREKNRRQATCDGQRDAGLGHRVELTGGKGGEAIAQDDKKHQMIADGCFLYSCVKRGV